MSSVPALTLAQITERGLDPAFRLLPPKMDTPEARVLLLAIALQESQLRDRRQLIVVVDKQTGQRTLKPLGPAKSFWGAEKTGGMVHGVRLHKATRDLAAVLYTARRVRPTDNAIWDAIEHDDVLAAGLARLLIYSDSHPLPVLGNAEGAWALYADRLWKPGTPRRETWDRYYDKAVEFVAGKDL